MADTPRRVAGPADPATRRRMLNERLAEREPMEMPLPKASIPDEEPDSTVMGAARALRRRKGRINQAVDDAS